MSKKIIFCADGTWNNPDNDDNQDGTPNPSNVYRLFANLQGTITISSDLKKEQERELTINGQTCQIAKYLHGIGDTTNKLAKDVEGSVGLGIIGRIVRGYTFISRNYDPGDEITIIGFSRGAYTARALADLIVSRGLLLKDLTSNKDEAYDYGMKVWYAYWYLSARATFSAKIWEACHHPLIFFTRNSVTDEDLIPVESINAVGVWDTVGALGIPNEIFEGSRVDHFRFVDLTLNPKIKNGFHAVSLDEQRKDFVPTLWEPEPRVAQELFPGAHSDVGGGYPIEPAEAGLLSDFALEWMMNNLSQAALFNTDTPAFIPKSCITASAHKPWKRKPMLTAERTFPSGTKENPAIDERINTGPVKADPSEDPVPYNPPNRPSVSNP